MNKKICYKSKYRYGQRVKGPLIVKLSDLPNLNPLFMTKRSHKMNFFRKINYKQKEIKYLDITKVLILILLLFSMIGCSGKKKGVLPFWMLGLTGTDSGSAGDTGDDSNGVLLPPPDDGNGDESEQEVATSGPGLIQGQIVPVIGDKPLCLNPPQNDSPPGCEPENGEALDLSNVTIKLVKNEDGKEVVVATTNPDADGNYNFTISDLENGNYRVLTNDDGNLNYAYEDIRFTHDPTAESEITIVDVNDLNPERMYHQSGAAIISGNVQTPGFNGDVTVPSGSLAGVEVELKDSDGNVIATTTTDSNGNYNFCFHSSSTCPAGGYTSEDYLNNGQYTVDVKGSTANPQHGRTYEDVSLDATFQFSGNDQNESNSLNLGNANLAWDAADSSDGTVKVTVNNAANSDTTTPFTVTLKDSVGNIISSTTQTGSSEVTLTGSDMTGGVYFVEVTSPNTLPASSSFNFIPHSAGGNKEITAPMVNVVPKPSHVTGSIQGPGGNPNPVPGSVVNFRPDSTQPPSNLLYLLQSDDERLRNLATLWISEACPTCYQNCATGGFQASCVVTNQGNGPWSYSTYSNKVYEVNGTELSFSAVAGKWEYYISAPGYGNSDPQTMLLNGQDENVPPIYLTPSDKRSQIKGSVVVLDTLTGETNPTPHTNVSGLFTVMLGNTNNAGQPVAHITTTAGGQFAFDGNSKVIPLTNLPDLDGDGAITDTDRVKYAIGAYQSAPLLSSGAGVSGIGATNSVDSTGGYYNFKQSSYQVVVADPLGHILTTPKQADNSGVVTNTYTDGNAILDLSGIQVPHISRRQISGTITDAFSTSPVDGATVTLGIMDENNQFQANVRRDCSDGETADSQTCTMPSVRAPGRDQVVPSVTTNSNGEYQINNINPGDYVLKVSKNGIDTYIPVTVPNNSDTVANGQVITTNGRGNLTGNVRQLNEYGQQVNFTGTYSIELVSPIFGDAVRPTAGVQPGTLTSGPTTFTNVPSYNVFGINAATWKVRFISAGYNTVEGIVNIQANATTSFDIITMIPGYQPPAAISGSAINAMTNTSSGMSGLTVRIREGVNVNSGPYMENVGAVTTGSDGSFAIPNVPAGNYTMEVSGPGVITTYRTVVSAGSDTPRSQDILVSPTLGAYDMRIVLSWNAEPKDLDSHLEFGSNNQDQVVWNDKCQIPDSNVRSPSPCGNEDLTLDIDVVNGYGPETVSLKGAVWSKPRRGYSVFNWSRYRSRYAPEMSTSGAVVKVFKKSGMVRSYAISPSQTGLWWRIFCLTSDKSIIDVGQSGCNANDFFDNPAN